MNIARRALFGKLNLTLFRAMESATAFCKLRGNPYVELIHWLHQLWQQPDNDLRRIVRHYQLDVAKLERDLAIALQALPAGASSISDFSYHIENAVERAWVLASLGYRDVKIRGAWLLAALLGNQELRRVLLGISGEFQKIALDSLDEPLMLAVRDSSEENDAAQDGSGLTAAMPGQASGALPDAASDGAKVSALNKYCQDLTARASEAQLDPVVGREREIRTMMDILLRRRQNNPLLTGEAGVGKTAVVEGLALAIAEGKVPPALREARLLALDVGALLAGASMRGEFEARLKALLEEAGRAQCPIILFVDEVHTLVGAGDQAGTGDAANLLKPALARGNLRCIGATTWSEYKKHIEKDPALTRRFQVLQVPEPQEDAAIEMVRGLAGTFRRHHGVDILDEAVRAAVVLSHRYIPSRQLPDKAISLLDTACARVAMSLHAAPVSVLSTRERLQALQVELDLQRDEHGFGQERQAQLEALSRRKSEIQQTLQQQEHAWQTELKLVRDILALRARLTEAEAAQATTDNTPLQPPDAQAAPTLQPQVDASAVRSELQLKERELVALQGDTPLVHALVNEAVVADIVSDWTGIPVGRMVQDDVAAVIGLQGRLRQRVVGQEASLSVICERVRIARAGLADPRKPVGAFLLVGPSGVGKTESALALAEALYGGEQNLITINMSEYQEAHTVSSLKGAPPGYVGYGEGGVLTEAVRRRPYSVILLDEIEKAHPDVHELFYQVFDKGQMEDGEGRFIDFKNTLILLTSNIGADMLTQLCDDPALVPPPQALADMLRPELRKVFPAAFLGRLSVVPYLPLAPQVLADIVHIQIGRVAQRLLIQHGIELRFDESVTHYIVQQCGMHEAGARRLGQYIELHLLPQLAQYWLDAMLEKKTIRAVLLSANTHGLQYQVEWQHPDVVGAKSVVVA